MDIDELSKRLYAEVMAEVDAMTEENQRAIGHVVDEKLAKYNEDVKVILEGLIYDELKDSFKNEPLPDAIISKPELSQKLYRNAKEVSAVTQKILKDSIKAKAPIKEISKKLYDGYGFNDKEVLDIKKRLPKYLQAELKKGVVSKDLIIPFYTNHIGLKPLNIGFSC